MRGFYGKELMMSAKLEQTSQNTCRLGLLPWIMWGLGALFYCYEFCLQVSTSVMKDILMKEFQLSAASMANLSSFYLYAYALMQIPVGIMLDRFGARRLLTLASLCCALGALCFAYAHVYWVASFGRAMIGFGSAFAAVSCLQIAACWLPLRHFALMTGVLLTIGMLGAFIGEGPMAHLIEQFGWRETTQIFGFVGIGIAVLIYTIVRDRPVSENANCDRVLENNFFAGLTYVIRQPRVWIASIYGGLMYMSIISFTSLWGVPFLMASYGLTKTTAAFINSLSFLGFAAGAPFFGWLSDRIGRRKVPMGIAAVGATITLSASIFAAGHTLTYVSLLLTLFGFFTSAFLPVFSLAREVTPPETNATTLGFVNTLNMLGGAGAALLIGYLLDQNWDGRLVEGSRLYGTDAYHAALIILPMALVLALITLLFIKETHCKQLTEFNN